MGLFNPQSREEQARYVYCENARFREDLRENKRKSEVRLNLRFWSEWQDLNLRPLPPQGSALPTAPHPDLVAFLNNAWIIPQRIWNVKGFYEKSVKKCEKSGNGPVNCMRVLFCGEIPTSGRASLGFGAGEVRKGKLKRESRSRVRCGGGESRVLFSPKPKGHGRFRQRLKAKMMFFLWSHKIKVELFRRP